MGAETLFYSDVKDRSVSGTYDFALVWAVLLLLALGLVMVYSSSIAIAEGGRSYGQQPAYFLLRQGVYLAVSFVLAMAAFQVPVAVWQKGALYLFLLGVGLLALAVAAVLEARGWKIVWLGSPSGMEARLVPQHGYTMAWVSMSGVRGKGLLITPCARPAICIASARVFCPCSA